MAKTKKKKMTPEEVAAKENPQWEVIPPQPKADAKKSALQPDVVTPELPDLLKKFFGNDVKIVETPANRKKKTTLVKMKPKTTEDTTPGSKTSVVEGDIVIGKQG
jgi:hypothetical protein